MSGLQLRGIYPKIVINYMITQVNLYIICA
jgi:hypothetical protein